MIKLCSSIQLNNNIQFCKQQKSILILNKRNTIDTISFTGATLKKNFKVGECIENIGLVIKNVKIINKETAKVEDCYIVYQKTEKDGAIRLIKNAPIKINSLSRLLTKNPSIFEVLKKYGFRTPEKVLNEIKSISTDCYNLFKDLIISEIAYTTLTTAKGKQRAIDAGYKCIEGLDIVAIEHFITKQKKYNEASRFVALPLLQALRQNNDKNIIIRALAIGEDSQSPVDLYLKSGFIPIKKTIQDIEQHRIETPNGKKVDPKYEVTMYLPQDAHIYDIIEKFPFTNEINTINPNWFKRAKDKG